MTQTLVSEARYRALSRDLSTSQVDVEAALADAVEAIEDRLHRGLEAKERTESLLVHRNLEVYPPSTPILVAEGYTRSGNLLWASSAAFPSPIFFGSVIDVPYRLDVTYTGGWTADTLPSRIERAIVATAKAFLAPASQAPAGALQVTVGDAHVQYAKPTDADLPPGVWESIKGYRHREVIPT